MCMMIQGFYAYKKTSTISYVKESQAEINVYVLISNCVVVIVFLRRGRGISPLDQIRVLYRRSVYYTAAFCNLLTTSSILLTSIMLWYGLGRQVTTSEIGNWSVFVLLGWRFVFGIIIKRDRREPRIVGCHHDYGSNKRDTLSPPCHLT